MPAEKHQFCYLFMRNDKGTMKRKTFWGCGDPETARADARRQAENYRYGYENDLNNKERLKPHSYKGIRFAPSHISVSLLGGEMWQ